MTTLSDYQNLHLELHLQHPTIQNNHKKCLESTHQEKKRANGWKLPTPLLPTAKFCQKLNREKMPGPGKYNVKRGDELDVLAMKWRDPRKNPLYKKESGRGLDSNMFLF